MSSDSENRGSVGDGDAIAVLHDIIDKFCGVPDSHSNVRFGYLKVPAYLTMKHDMIEILSLAIRKSTDSTPIFALTHEENRLFSSFKFEHLPMLQGRDQTIDHAQLCAILEDSRYDTAGWAQGNASQWTSMQWLPTNAFIVFSMDPWMSAPCALALTGLVHWACDVAKNRGANIRVLTFSNFSGGSQLSELVSLRSEEPVDHIELSSITHSNLFPDGPRSDGLGANEDAAAERPLRIKTDQAGAFISGLYGMSPWGVDVGRVSRCFIKSPAVISRVTGILQKEGLIHKHRPTLALTDTEETIYHIALRMTRHDHRIAHFLALASSDVKVRLVKVQLAVVLAMSKDWTVEIEPGKHFGHDVPAFGWGSNLHNHGDLWQVLGMWKAIAVNCKEFERLPHSEERVSSEKGYLKLPIGAAQDFHITNRDLKNALNESELFELPTHRMKDETEALNDDQTEELLQHLVRAYQHQLIATRLAVVHGQVHLKHSAVSTGRSVEIRSKRTVLPLPNAIFKNVQRNGVLCGICTEFIKDRHSLVAMNWTWIPQYLVEECTRSQG